MDFYNATPFSAGAFLLTDTLGYDTLLIVVKGSWRVQLDGSLAVADEQAPIATAPRYHGPPVSSSLIHDTDLHLHKPGTDCALIGCACAPRPGCGSMEVTFGVGPVAKTVRVFGDRRWGSSLGRVTLSRPEPFEKIPLRYELAFGGTDTSDPDPLCHESFPPNPVGRGFRGTSSRIPVEELFPPNIETPGSLVASPSDRPPPAGFGMIPPHWHPRATLVGSYDERWQTERAPLPPQDQDPLFFSGAGTGLASRSYLRGDEEVFLAGASPEGPLRFRLPGWSPAVLVALRQGHVEPALRLDTVAVEPEAHRVTITWRGSMRVHGRLYELLRTRLR